MNYSIILLTDVVFQNKMSDSDSDCSLSSLVMRRVNSGHRTVPENVEFIFKPKFGEKGKRQPFLYTLKQGKELPHETDIEGLFS